MTDIEALRITREQREEIQERFRRTGGLTARKLREYIPAMIMTNISVLLLVTVDGIVAGNLLGKSALSAINLYFPASMLISSVGMLILNGAATSLSTCVGRSDIEGLRNAKAATIKIMVVFAIAITILQIPIVQAMIASYGLAPNIADMTWTYAMGAMVATPFAVVSQTGVAQLQVEGRMKVIMWISGIEGIANLTLDVLFVGPLGMGIIGSGLGTAGAGIVRCIATVLYLRTKTDMYKTGGAKPGAAAYKEIISCGLPEASNILMLAVQNYLLMQIVISVFGGTDGGVIKGVCVFCFGISFVIIGGVQGSMRPLLGLMIGMEDWVGLRLLVQQSMKIVTYAVGVLTILFMITPGWFFALHGVATIPEAGELSLRLFALHCVFRGYSTLFRLYFANRKESKFATTLTIVCNGLLPVFAWALSLVLPPAFIWLSYLASELVSLAVYLRRYKRRIVADMDNADSDMKALFLTVKPEEAVEASREIRRYAQENGCSQRVAYRAALCMEEMVAYAVQSQKRRDVQIQILVRFKQDGGTFMMLDDGACIALNEDKEQQDLITGNYDLVKKMAKSVSYQYVLNMNQTIMQF